MNSRRVLHPRNGVARIVQHKGITLASASSSAESTCVELIFVDDGSRDRTREMLNRTPRRIRAIPYQIVGRRAGDLPEYYAEPSLAEEIVGWHAQHDIDRMCRDKVYRLGMLARAWEYVESNRGAARSR